MKKVILPILFAVCVLTLAGCSSKSSNYEAEYEVLETQAAAYAAGYYDAVTADEAPIVYKEADAEVSASGTNGVSYGANEAVSPDISERKLIRNIDISLETENFDEVTGGIVSDTKKYGGYIENSSYYYGGYNDASNRNANFTVRIPADKADEFLNQSYPNTHITSRNEYTEDVSLQYSDLETRLSTLEAERDRLQELIKEAQDVESLVVLEQRLSEIRYELESIHTSLKNYDNKVDYTTVWFYICEVKKIEPPAEATFGERIKDGFERSTENLGKALGDFAVWFLSNILTILFVLVLIGAVILIVLAVVKGAKKRSIAAKERTKQTEKREQSVQKEEKQEE